MSGTVDRKRSFGSLGVKMPVACTLARSTTRGRFQLVSLVTSQTKRRESNKQHFSARQFERAATATMATTAMRATRAVRELTRAFGEWTRAGSAFSVTATSATTSSWGVVEHVSRARRFGVSSSSSKTWMQSVLVSRASSASSSSGFISAREATHRRGYRPPPPSSFGSQFGFGSSHGGYWSKGDRALWGLIAANGGVYYLWATQGDERFMRKNFMVSEESIASGRYHTMLTSAFSHFDMAHLGVNMVALYFFGKSVADRFGGRYLLTLYCVGGVGASAAHVLWCRRQRERRRRRYRDDRGNFFDRMERAFSDFVEDQGARRGYYFTPSALGASGAVNAIVAFEVLLYPLRTIYLYAILPVPSILLGGLFLLRDLAGIQNGQGSGVAHAGHLGGAAVGALALATLRARRRVF